MRQMHEQSLKLTPKPFYFLRHGETQWNKNSLYQGRLDIPLNEMGLRQAEEVKPFVRDTFIAHVFSSHLSRARKTAEIINEQLGVEHRIKENLQECNFGSLEGVSVTPESKQVVSQWIEGKHHTGGETYAGFITRSIQAINDCLDESPLGIPLIVAHGGVFGTLNRPMGLGSAIYLKNCELVLCEPGMSNVWRVVSINGLSEEFE